MVLCLSVMPYSATAEPVEKTRVLRGNFIELDGQKRLLHGVVVPVGDSKCTAKLKSWPCGASATLRLHKLLQGRPLECTEAHSSIMHPLVRCIAKGYDIARILIAEGWGLVAEPISNYLEVEESAKLSGAGIWRDGFIPPNQWRNYPVVELDLIENLMCSECAIRNSN